MDAWDTRPVTAKQLIAATTATFFMMNSWMKMWGTVPSAKTFENSM
jgi:hypothetical protein